MKADQSLFVLDLNERRSDSTNLVWSISCSSSFNKDNLRLPFYNFVYTEQVSSFSNLRQFAALGIHSCNVDAMNLFCRLAICGSRSLGVSVSSSVATITSTYVGFCFIGLRWWEVFSERKIVLKIRAAQLNLYSCYLITISEITFRQNTVKRKDHQKGYRRTKTKKIVQQYINECQLCFNMYLEIPMVELQQKQNKSVYTICLKHIL